MAIFHEIGNGSAARLVNPLVDKVMDINQASLGGNNGRLSAAPAGKCPISSKEFWSSIDKNGTPPETGPKIGVSASLSAQALGSIANVPYYHQDDFGANSCGPTASAQALGYWDTYYYGNLVDNGSPSYAANPIHVRELVYNLMRAEGYNPTIGTYGDQIEPGIEAVCNSSTYGNNLNFNVTAINAPSWATIKNEIIAGRPFVYFNWNRSAYPDGRILQPGRAMMTTG